MTTCLWSFDVEMKIQLTTRKCLINIGLVLKISNIDTIDVDNHENSHVKKVDNVDNVHNVKNFDNGGSKDN